MAVGWTLVAQRAVTVVVFQFCRFVFCLVQRLFWELNGTAHQSRQAAKPQNYRRSAHVLDIIWSECFCDMKVIQLSDFVCVHNRFEDPQYIVDNEHITLLTIDGQRAVFGVASDKG